MKIKIKYIVTEWDYKKIVYLMTKELECTMFDEIGDEVKILKRKFKDLPILIKIE